VRKEIQKLKSGVLRSGTNLYICDETLRLAYSILAPLRETITVYQIKFCNNDTIFIFATL
jgi:hypothetical protein